MNLLRLGRAMLRKRWLYYARRRATEAMLARRRGACRACGRCCANTVPWCPFLSGTLCRCYPKIPLFCALYPLDRQAQREDGVESVCGYYWDDDDDDDKPQR